MASLNKQLPSAAASVNALITKGIFESFKKSTTRLDDFQFSSTPESIELNEGQQKALDEIHLTFNENKTALLHGVTSSGKTEIYIKLIKRSH